MNSLTHAMPSYLNFDYRKYQDHIEEIDKEVIQKHNLSSLWEPYSPKSKYYLHHYMRPCPFEGDLLKAKVILLLANPGFDNTQDPKPSKADHEPKDGWGIANLAPNAGSNWYRPRFRSLLGASLPEEEEWQVLSNKLAMIQVIPWASEKYKDLKLPSRSLMSKTVQALSEANKDALFVVMRRKAFWLDALKNVDSSRIIINPHPIITYISKGNFGDDWNRIKKKLDE
jgi:hypothetical protein